MVMTVSAVIRFLVHHRHHCVHCYQYIGSSVICFCAGLDYVGHEDVLPYRTTQKQPIFNHLFDKFIVASDTTAGAVATCCRCSC